jgi:hypothetical protein
VNGVTFPGATAVSALAAAAMTIGDLTVAGETFTIPAGMEITLVEDASITLTGNGTVQAMLVLANAVDETAAAGGGGKLVLDGSTVEDLGTDGVIQVAQTASKTQLTGMGNGEKGFVFDVDATNSGITSLGATLTGFISIEAATVEAADDGTKGLVTLSSTLSGTTVIDKTSPLGSK